MKAGRFIVIVILIVSLVFSACSQSGVTKEIVELNQNSNLDFEMVAYQSEIESAEGYTAYPGFGCSSFRSSDELTTYTVSGFPDCLDSYRLTGFSTSDPKYNVYGIHVGMDLESAIAILKDQKYKKIEEDSSTYTLKFSRGKVTIRLSHDSQNEICALDVYLKTTNKKNVVF